MSEYWGIRYDGEIIPYRDEEQAREFAAKCGGEVVHRVQTPWEVVDDV